jgi:hypothetical protein
MAVAVEMNFKGATTDQYDQVIQRMGLKQGGPMPPGGISHFVTQTGNGLLIIDVWESRDAYEKFGKEQIGPYSQEAGITEPPETRFFDVHNYLTRT